MLSDAFIEEIKQKNNIVDVVGKYCTLKKRGSSHWACCPLPNHSERTPSFSVNEPGQFYKCFGCGRGGNVITFIMTMENLDFVGAVKLLAEQSGIAMPDDDRGSEQIKKDRSDRDRLLSLMKSTALFYAHNLMADGADKHREYLLERGFDTATVATFGIGASLDFDGLPKHLREQGYTDEEMIKCGVCANYERGGRKNIGDALYGRLIIPIINNMGNVIAFGGRLLEKKPNFAKYKNTQETVLFIKNRTLYNLNNLKKEKAKGNLSSVIMVEGYMDAISLYRSGFKNVVASMGTSLTVEQARMLKRYTDTVLISYDGDGAGQKATIRGLEILKAEGLEVKVVNLPDGLDPDDVINKYGAEKYGELLEESIPLVDFKLFNLSESYDLKDVSQRRKYISEAIKIISASDSESEREDLLKKLSRETSTTYESLKRDMDKQITGETAPTVIDSLVGGERAGGTVNAERFILCAMLFSKRYAENFDVFSINYSSPTREKIADIISSYREQSKEIFPATVAALMAEDELAEYEAVLSSGDNVFGSSAETKFFEDCKTLLEKEKLKEDLKALNSLFKDETDTEKRKDIAKLIAELTAKLRK